MTHNLHAAILLPAGGGLIGRVWLSRTDHRWVSDFSYVPTWTEKVYVAFVIAVFEERIVGWKVSTSMVTQFVLDALEQALWPRKAPGNNDLIHGSNRGSQYLTIESTERRADAAVNLSVGTVGDAYDNALAE